MKKSIVLIISLLAIAVIASSTFSWAHRQGRSGHSGMSHGECVNHAGKKLSQEQREQLSALRHRFTDETVETRTAIANLYNEINMKMKTSGPDRNELVSLVKQLEPLKVKLAIKRIDFQLAAKKIAPEFCDGFFNGRGGYRHGRGHGRRHGQHWNGNCPGNLDNSPAK